MTEYLCLGDRELLQDIADGKVTDDANLNDSQRRSARHLYNERLISALPFEGAEALRITLRGRERLAKEDSNE